MRAKRIYEGVKDFLFSNMNKQFLIFMFFLLLSGIFWLIMTLNETYEQEIKIPAQVVNIPKDVVLTSATTDTIKVTVKDKGWIVMSYLYGDKLKTVRIPFKNLSRGDGSGTISSTETKRLVEQQLEASSKISAIKPDKLTFYYNNGEYKRVPVRWAGRVMPDQLYFISMTTYKPDSVDVYATKEKLDSIRVIYTEALNYTNFRDTLRVSCRLSHPQDVKVEPDHVQIEFYTDVLTEETIEGVPVMCVNLPAGKALRTFPAKVDIHFVAGASLIRSLRPEDFVVVADYYEIKEQNKEKCNIYLRSVPQGVSRATLITKQVDYLIEEE